MLYGLVIPSHRHGRGLLQFALLCLKFQQAEPGVALTSTHPSEADASCNAALRFKLLLILLCTIHPRDTCVYVCVCEHTEAVGPTF